MAAPNSTYGEGYGQYVPGGRQTSKGALQWASQQQAYQKSGANADGTPNLNWYMDPNNYPEYQGSPVPKLQQGGSPWLDMATNRQNLDFQGLRQDLDNKTAGQTASAWDALATQGGLSSGARERMGVDIANNATLAGQNLGLENQRAITNLGVANEDWNRDAKKFDIGNYMQDAQNRNNFNLGKFQMGSQAAASQYLANIMGANR